MPKYDVVFDDPPPKLPDDAFPKILVMSKEEFYAWLRKRVERKNE